MLSLRFSLRKYLLGHRQTIQGSRESSVDSHLHDGFNHFCAAHTYIDGALDMYLELGRGISQCGECGNNRNLPTLQIQARSGVDVPERELDRKRTANPC